MNLVTCPPSRSPAPERRRSGLRSCLLCAAAAALLAGCVATDFEPKSHARNDIFEAGTPRGPRQAPEQPSGEAVPAPVASAPQPGPGQTFAHPEHPAQEVLARTQGPIRAPQAAPKVNIFGEFGGDRAPFAPAGRGGFQQHTSLDEGFDIDVAVDPAGQWLVFASTRHSRRSDIYIQRVNGLAVTKLTGDQGDNAFPTFSPDGRRIAFASNRSGNWDIYVMDTDGRNVTAVTTSASNELHPTFSPDGRRLAYCASGRDGVWELWVADLSSGERTMIGHGLFPSWSPRMDRDVIAFQRARQRGGRWFSLWTLDLVEGEPLNLTEIAHSAHVALVAPKWSPDGLRVTFGTVAEPDGPGSPRQQDIWIANADGSGRAKLTDGRGLHANPFWGRDGRIYFISDRGGAEAIWSTRALVEGESSHAGVDAAPAGR